MPPWNRLGRLALLATLPETRGLIVSTVHSPNLRTLARRAVKDRGGLRRNLANPAKVRQLARSAIRHPAVAELATAGMTFLPARYMPLGWAATWATSRVLRRYLALPAEAREGPLVEAGRPPVVEAHERSAAERSREGR